MPLFSRALLEHRHARAARKTTVNATASTPMTLKTNEFRQDARVRAHAAATTASTLRVLFPTLLLFFLGLKRQFGAANAVRMTS